MRNFSLVRKFSVILFFALILFGGISGKVISSSMRSNMVTRSCEMTADFLRHEINRNIAFGKLLCRHSGSCFDELSKRICNIRIGPNVKITHMKIWDNDRRVLWSTDKNDVGKSGYGNDQLNAVFNSHQSLGLSSVQQLKVNFDGEATSHETMEFFMPVSGITGGGDMVFEVHASVEKLVEEMMHRNNMVWGSILLGSVILYALLFGLFWEASRRIEKQNRKIRQSEDRYRNLIYSAQEGIVSADRNGKILLMNEAAELIFDYTIEEMENMHFSSLFAADENDDLHEELQIFFEYESCCALQKNFESKGQRKDGEVFPMEVSLSVSGEEGNWILTGWIRDITQRDQLFDQLALAKKEWEETFDTINDAITIHDMNYNITLANKAAVQLLGLPVERILGQKCFKSYHGEDQPPAICSSCETLRTGIESTKEIYEPFLKKFLEVKALPRLDKENNLTGLVHVVADISERKKAEEKQFKLQAQLNQAQKMESIGRLAGGIAHDFNNILTAILGYSQLVLKELPPESKLCSDVNTVIEAGRKAAVLTGQLLAFSRKQVLCMRPTDLNQVVEDLVRILSRVIGEDIILDLHLSPDIDLVVADPGQIEQVMFNLAVNARDAMPAGGHFIIETSMVNLTADFIEQHGDGETQYGPHVLLAVTDTGSGIEEKNKEHIFDPFFTTKEVGKGTGLGLATVYGIIKQHGGLIYVYSELDKGTTFKIYLPVGPQKEIEKKEKPFDIIPKGDETILLVEDDTDVRQLVEIFLAQGGYKILSAPNGHEALGESRNYDGVIDLLLTDVIMPKMNGQELANELRKTRPDIQVIFMSGYTDDVIAHHGVLEEGVHFIQKPITMNGLSEKIREVMNKE